MLLDVRDLVEQPGASRRATAERPVAGLRTELVQVPADRPIAVDLLLESVVAGILATGTLQGTHRLTCARCLSGFESPFRVDVRELFAPDAAGEDDEAYPLAEGHIDLEPVIRDAVVLAMPYSPLCRSDCRGLCERCGEDRNTGACSCRPAEDARWAPLAGLMLDDDGADAPSRSN